ncbi:MAG: hypothetical protein SVO01_03690 [Thermotogota bacterium]|nr:hypothetical protein [Thermotogota bacterium]
MNILYLHKRDNIGIADFFSSQFVSQDEIYEFGAYELGFFEKNEAPFECVNVMNCPGRREPQSFYLNRTCCSNKIFPDNLTAYTECTPDSNALPKSSRVSLNPGRELSVAVSRIFVSSSMSSPRIFVIILTAPFFDISG